MKRRQHRHRPGPSVRRTQARPPFLAERIATLADLLARAAMRSSVRGYGVAPREWRILAVLGEGRPLSAAEVSRRTAIDKGLVGRAAANLAGRGLVERTADAFDARRTLLRLTLKGRALYRRIAPLAATQEQALLAGLSMAERRELARMLARVHERAAVIAARAEGDRYDAGDGGGD